MSKSKDVKTSSKKSSKDVTSKIKDVKSSKPTAAAPVKSEKKKSKKVKEPTPEPSSSESESSEEEEDSDEDSESDDSESEVEAPAPKANGASKKAATPSDSDDSSSDESDAPAPKKTAAPKDDDTSDESDDSSDDEAPTKTNGAVKLNGSAKKAEADSDSESDSEDDDEDKNSDDSSDSDEEEEAAPSKKRKAEDDAEPAAKKTKTEESDGPKTLFVGRLSWNVDDDWLRKEFESYGEITGARIMMDRQTGKSKGMGYVDFASHESAKKALEEAQGAEIDGRPVNLDFATPRPARDGDSSRQKSFGDTIGTPTETLFVGNLSFDITDDVLREVFEPYGTITRVSIPTDQESGRVKGFGYVGFSSVEEAKAGLEAGQGYEILGRACRLDYSQPRPERSDRGGFGGGRGGGRGRGGFGGGDRGRGGRGGGRGRGGDRGGRGGRGNFTTNRGGFGDFKGKKTSFD